MLFKLLTSLDYKKLLLTTLTTSYTIYQDLFDWFTRREEQKNFREKNSQNTITILTAKEKSSQKNKNFYSKRKIFTSKKLLLRQKNSQSKRKILTTTTTTKKFSQQKKNFHSKRKILAAKEKILTIRQEKYTHGKKNSGQGKSKKQ